VKGKEAEKSGASSSKKKGVKFSGDIDDDHEGDW
jgi:hypothetical protein